MKTKAKEIVCVGCGELFYEVFDQPVRPWTCPKCGVVNPGDQPHT